MSQVLLWGIRTSFLRYLSHAGPHQITGERATENGAFAFREVTTGDGSGLAFSGLIDIVAHGGLLHLTLRDPVLQLDSNGRGTLTFKYGDARTPVELLTLTPASRTRWNAQLTPAGATVFDDIYPPGVPMADVVLTESIG